MFMRASFVAVASLTLSRCRCISSALTKNKDGIFCRRDALGVIGETMSKEAQGSRVVVIWLLANIILRRI